MPRDISFRSAVLMMQSTSRDFYVAMGDRATDRTVTDIYYFLASEEVRRIEALQKLQDLETSTELLDKAFEEAGESLRYMMPGALEGSMPAAPLSSPKEALAFALRQKKDAILFYHTLLRHVGDEQIAEQIQAVMEIEYSQVNNLSQLLSLVSRQQKKRGTRSGRQSGRKKCSRE